MPRFLLGRKTFDKIGKVASNYIILNIEESKQFSGQPIKVNAPSTVIRKSNRPGDQGKWHGVVRPLIDIKRRFIKPGQSGSWRWFAYDDYVRISAGSEELRRLNQYVQRKGYVGWIGISKKAKELIRAIAKKRIIEIIKQQARKR